MQNAQCRMQNTDDTFKLCYISICRYNQMNYFCSYIYIDNEICLVNDLSV